MARTKGRASRRDWASQRLRDAAEKVREADTPEKVADAEGMALDAREELDALGAEVGEWATNIEERFSNTEKYERLREAEDALSQAVGDLDGDAPTDTEEEREGTAAAWETVADEADGVEFPGMYG
jgi:hypothetical protein